MYLLCSFEEVLYPIQIFFFLQNNVPFKFRAKEEMYLVSLGRCVCVCFFLLSVNNFSARNIARNFKTEKLNGNNDLGNLRVIFHFAVTQVEIIEKKCSIHSKIM